MWNEGTPVMEVPRASAVEMLCELMGRRHELVEQIKVIDQQFDEACKICKDWDAQKRGER